VGAALRQFGSSMQANGGNAEFDFQPARRIIVQGLAVVEDIVYVGLGILLTLAVFSLFYSAVKLFVTALLARTLSGQIVNVLDAVLLILLVIELLYTVQVSFREHGLHAEPFLVVALIAVIRRVLILTATLAKLPESGEVQFRHAILELGLLTVMVMVLVGSLITFQKHTKTSQSS